MIEASGQGELWGNPSADRARERFRAKSRQLLDKRTTVAEAVTALVHDGDYLAIGGFGSNRIPTAVVHEVVRQGVQDLSFAGHTSTHDFQILCAGNLTGRGRTLARVDAAYIVGLEARGLSPQARRVMESGEVSCVEWSNYALAARFKAAAMGLPFLPSRTMLGTDTFQHSAAKVIRCPFTNQKLAALPALYPDVAAIHVPEADPFGNCRIRGTTVADPDLARAAFKLIITCERIVPTEEIRRDPSSTVIPYYCVDAVCEVPYGSYPGNMPYEYASDEDHLRAWLAAERDEATYRAFLDRYLFGPKSFDDYLRECGGPDRLEVLRQREALPESGKPAMTPGAEYNTMELMICVAARILEDGASVAVGTGAPCAAAMLAQSLHAPSLTILFEAGGVAPILPTMPISVGDSRTFHRAVMAASMAEVIETCQRGMVDYAFLGGAQIDPFGNLNSTLLGPERQRPKVRLPGSGGANDLASLCWRSIVMTNHDRRRFVERLDFLTTPGHLNGPGLREAAGLPPGTGPYRVVTNLAVLGYHPQTLRMQVLSLHPGVTPEQVAEDTEFPLEPSETIGTTHAPTSEELTLLRMRVDPLRYVIGRC